MEDARYFDGGKLVVFKRNQFYQHRSFIDGIYVWKTLKTANRDDAVGLAWKSDHRLQTLQEQGVPLKAVSFNGVIE